MQDHSERAFPPTSLADMKSEKTQWLTWQILCYTYFFFQNFKKHENDKSICGLLLRWGIGVVGSGWYMALCQGWVVAS